VKLEILFFDTSRIFVALVEGDYEYLSQAYHKLDFSLQTVVRAVQKLEGLGLISREREGRIKRITITDNGWKMYSHLQGIMKELNDK